MGETHRTGESPTMTPSPRGATDAQFGGYRGTSGDGGGPQAYRG